MQVNVTVFFQIANFLVSMYFVRRYFFEPFLDHLIKKKYLIKTLDHACAVEKEKVAMLEKTSVALVEQFQHNAVSHYPQEETVVSLAVPEPPATPRPEKPQDTDVEALVIALKEKIRHEFLP